LYTAKLQADIEAEAKHYMKDFCEDRMRPTPALSRDALKALGAYNFEENSMELKAIMERALVHVGNLPCLLSQ